MKHLLKIVFIKALCRKANVEKLDAGPKGVVIHFRGREFADPVKLVRYIAASIFAVLGLIVLFAPVIE